MFNDSGFDGIDVASKQGQIEYGCFRMLSSRSLAVYPVVEV